LLRQTLSLLLTDRPLADDVALRHVRTRFGEIGRKEPPLSRQPPEAMRPPIRTAILLLLNGIFKGLSRRCGKAREVVTLASGRCSRSL